MWYVGLDWSDTHHDVVVLDDAGKRAGARRFPHSPEGLDELKQFVLSIATSPENLACIVETSHGLLISFLLSAGFPVYPVNPKMAQKLRKVAGAKTDQIDAYVLARLGRFELDELRRLEPDGPTVQELKLLTRDQDALVQTQTRLINQLIACLKDYYPVALHLFTRVAAALHPPVFSGVSDPASGTSSVPGRDQSDITCRKAHQPHESGSQGLRKSCIVHSWKPPRSSFAPNLA